MRSMRMAAITAALASASVLPLAQAQAATLVLDVSDVFSVDPLGDVLNTSGFFNLGANSQITGIGWDFTMFADSPSWLSEMSIFFDNTNGTGGITLTPAVGDDFPGQGDYSGYGDLVDLGLSFNTGADGLLYIEFFESFDDYPDDWDGIYLDGTLTIDYNPAAGVVPEPSAWALLIAGFGVVGGAMRRRRQRTTVAYA